MEAKNLPLLWQYVEKWTEEQPAAEALLFGEERLSLSDFRREMNAAAKALLEIGVVPGDRVAMLSICR